MAQGAAKRSPAISDLYKISQARRGRAAEPTPTGNGTAAPLCRLEARATLLSLSGSGVSVARQKPAGSDLNGCAVFPGLALRATPWAILLSPALRGRTENGQSMLLPLAIVDIARSARVISSGRGILYLSPSRNPVPLTIRSSVSNVDGGLAHSVECACASHHWLVTHHWLVSFQC